MHTDARRDKAIKADSLMHTLREILVIVQIAERESVFDIYLRERSRRMSLKQKLLKVPTRRLQYGATREN